MAHSPSVRLRSFFAYGLGECANSLVMNGFFGFAMLYYTEALRLSPSLAGIAMSVSVFWEAITEPIMGHVSDRTRSRFGRRHPWMLVGGAIMAVGFYYIWAVPGVFRADHTRIFWYLVAMNLVLRSGLTMFFIPYLALGFEMAPDPKGRGQVQAVRQVFNMAANFAGPAMAWTFFFHDRVAADGKTIPGTSDPDNFITMGLAFAIATAVLVIAVVILTRRWIEDSRTATSVESGGLAGFWREMKAIVLDPNPRWVFVFIFFVCVGMVLVSSLQMYVYVYFMKFGEHEKSLAHGSTMIGMALGGAGSAWLSTRLGKRQAVLIGGIVSVAGNAALAALFLTGFMPIGTTTALLAFIAFHATYWFGNGIMLPVSTAMIGDVSALDRARTGVNRDGGYSAVFSLAMRLAISFALMGSGWILSGIGFAADEAHHEPATAVIWRLGAAMFVAGPLVSVAALLAIRRYPFGARDAVLEGTP